MAVNEVRRVMDEVLTGQTFDRKAFEYYHLHRNYFNVKNEVTILAEIGNAQFRDNLGFIWTEVSTMKNFFHMPKTNWVGSMIGVSEPYSRKFLRDDTTSGLNGEFEMIIRTSDGKRIDGITHAGYQETYNFGRTRNFTEHKALDVDPHTNNPNYQIKIDNGYIRIIKK